MEDFAGHVVPHRPLGLRLHRRRPGRAADRARRQGRRAHRHRRHRHPVPAAAGRGGQARLRVPAHAVGHRRARQPADRARLRRAAASPAGSRPGWTTSRRSCSASTVDEDLTDDGWTHHYAAVHHPPRRKGMTIEEYMRGAEELDFGIMEEHRQRVDGAGDAIPPPPRSSSRTTATCASGPASTTSTWRRSTSPNVTLVDCPAGFDARDRAGPGRRRPAVRGRLPRLRHRASRPSSRRCTAGPATTSSAGAASRLAEKWADGAATPLRDDEPRLPEPVRDAGAGPAGRRHRQLHAARGARRRVRRRRRRPPRPSGASQVFDVSAEAEDAWTQKIVDSFVDGSHGHVRLHAVADQQRGQPAGR